MSAAWRGGDHTLHVREHPGDGPTFVLLRGFPDNLHIYDRIALQLAAAGARVVAFDFLGYGASDSRRATPTAPATGRATLPRS